MNALTSHLLIPFLLAGFAGNATAQNEGETQEKSEQQKAEPAKVLRAGQQDRQRAIDDKGNPVDVAGDADGTAGAVSVNASPREALSNLCSLQVMVSPPRLAAGESGTITLLLALQPHAVITSDAAWQVGYKASQGKDGELQLGPHVVKPAPLGTIEERFKGKPVYDNQALVEIPITIAAGTAHGKQHFEADVEVPLTDGLTGQALGMFRTKAMQDVVIGAPMARPVLLGAKAGAANAAGSNTLGAQASPKSSGPSDVTKAGAGKPTPSDPVAQDKSSPGSARPSPGKEPTGSSLTGGVAADDEGAPASSMPILPIALGGGVIVVLIALLALRKKS